MISAAFWIWWPVGEGLVDRRLGTIKTESDENSFVCGARQKERINSGHNFLPGESKDRQPESGMNERKNL